MLDLNQVGAFPSYDAAGNAQIRFGLYLPGIRPADGFSVVVRIIHSADRFNVAVPTQNADLTWDSTSSLDLWAATVTLANDPTSHSGDEGEYLYRFQLFFTQGGNKRLITEWFPDPFARATDIGLMSATVVSKTPAAFNWTDGAYQTPELQDLVVYELQISEFNDTFDGVIDRLDYLDSLGVNCLELMPVTSAKVDFDWGYGPVYHFSPSAHFGGSDALKRLVDAAHARGIAVILDVVYEHVDPAFAYYGVYNDIANTPGAPHPVSPMISGTNVWGFGPACDFTQTFTKDYFVAANQMWLDDYHVDGFRYDEITDLYVGDRAAGYKELAQRVYTHSLGIARFQRGGATSYSRIVQCAEALGISKQVMNETYTNSAWTNDLLYKVEDMISWNYVDDNFAHILDPTFSGYPSSQTVVDSSGNAVQRPVAPFQYLESHDHSQLIVFAGTVNDNGPLPEGNRDLYYKLQPYAIALYTCKGVPMLWQGQELADNYNLPDNGLARVHLRRDTHWEFFYDLDGQPLIRVYRRLGQLRRSSRALRGTSSYYYYQQSHQQTQIIAYHRYAPAAGSQPEDWAMILLNFAGGAAQISVPFPKAGKWLEMLDADQRTLEVDVASDNDVQNLMVPSNYGMVFIRQP